jgi:hypothetical protein
MRTARRLLPGEAFRSFMVKAVGLSPAMLAFEEWCQQQDLTCTWGPQVTLLPCAPGEQWRRMPGFPAHLVSDSGRTWAHVGPAATQEEQL